MMHHCLNCGRDYDYPTQGALCPHDVGGPSEGKPWPKPKKDEIVAREKSEIAIAIGLQVYARMVRLSHDSNQTVGEDRKYYVTLQQLEAVFVSIRDELRAPPAAPVK